jgi:hypothetical protein
MKVPQKTNEKVGILALALAPDFYIRGWSGYKHVQAVMKLTLT